LKFDFGDLKLDEKVKNKTLASLADADFLA
jgi:hypothetical protein